MALNTFKYNCLTTLHVKGLILLSEKNIKCSVKLCSFKVTLLWACVFNTIASAVKLLLMWMYIICSVFAKPGTQITENLLCLFGWYDRLNIQQDVYCSKVLPNCRIFCKISRTWKVLENDFGPGKFWKYKLKVLEFAGTQTQRCGCENTHVPMQLIAWKDSSPKWPIMCRVGC